MRIRILLVCAVAAALCLFLLLRRAPQQENNGLRPTVEAPVDREPVDHPAQPAVPEQAQAVNAPANPSTSTAAPVPVMPAAQSSNALYQQFMVEWQVPIDFYGKVVDERSNAVAGASVRFHWPEVPTENGSRTATTESDSAGLFSLHGKRGPSLTVWVSKQGYYASHGGQQGFSYAVGPEKYSADAQNPVVFELRRKGQGAELITSQNGIQTDLTVRVPKDNTPIRVDFVQKKAGASGQLEVSQSKPPWREATEWSFTLSIPDGGFVESSEEFQFEAPETNYQTTVQLHFAKGETNWRTRLKKSYYIAFGQPRRYGRVRVETDLSQESVFLTYAINPSGSRNLESASDGQ